MKRDIGHLTCEDCYYCKKDKTKDRREQCVNCPYKGKEQDHEAH